MNCSAFPVESYISVNATVVPGQDSQEIHFTLHDPMNCQQQSQTPSASNYDVLTDSIYFYGDISVISAPLTGYFGTIWSVFFEEGGPCPSFYGIFGRVSPNEIEDVTIFSCQPFAQKLEASAAFNAPGLVLDDYSPPVPEESTVNIFQLDFAEESGSPLWTFDSGTIIVPNSTNFYFGMFSSLVYGS